MRLILFCADSVLKQSYFKIKMKTILQNKETSSFCPMAFKRKITFFENFMGFLQLFLLHVT